MILRVGSGYDLHRLVPGRKLVLAGITIRYDKGLAGHSDADVVLHAVMDALLGAAGMGDIGEQFPDTDPSYRDADSTLLLGQVMALVRQKGYQPVNADITIIAEQPKLGPYKSEMRHNLAGLLGLEAEAVAVKAKTNEGLGDTGQGRAIICQALVSLGATAGES